MSKYSTDNSTKNSSIHKYVEHKKSRAALKNRSKTKNDENEKYRSIKKYNSQRKYRENDQQWSAEKSTLKENIMRMISHKRGCKGEE